MKKVTLTISFVVLMLSLSPAHLWASPDKTASQNRAAGEALQNPAAQASVNVERRLDSIDQKIGSPDVPTRLERIERAVNDLKHPSIIAGLSPSIIAAMAALGGILVGGVLQGRLQRARLDQEKEIAEEKATHERNLADAKAAQERALAEKQAKLQIGNAVVDWKLKQLSLLYGPARALLGQSSGLYRQMNIVLHKTDDPNNHRFRFLKVQEARGPNAGSGEEFQILTSGQWERFRTILHIDQIYGCGYGVETYFDEIVSIGARIVKIIEQNAGYARPEEEELMSVFAKYLAHFAVLNHLHGLAQAKLGRSRTQSSDKSSEGDVTYQLRVDVSAVFPTELHNLINTGFMAITKDIEHWQEKALA